MVVSNDFIFPILSLLGLTFVIFLGTGLKKSQWKNNFIFIWTLIVYLQYLLFSPLYFFLSDKKVLNGTYYYDYYATGFFFSWLAIFFLGIGFFLKKFPRKRAAPKIEKVLINPTKSISILFYVTYGIVLMNMALGGINVQNVFLGSDIVGMGAEGASYYLQNFTDSLITILLLAFLYDFPRKQIIIWLAMSFFLFSILGFRYRIILTLFGILFILILRRKITTRMVIGGLLLAVFFLYLIMFSTENRRVLISRNYDKLKFDPTEYKAETIFDQSRGALADMCVYKLYDDPYKSVKYDYGVSLFGYIFIRMIPRAILTNKDDFYPPPQLAITLSAYEAWWGKYTGEATLSVGAMFIALGWLGIVIGHFFWGVLLRRYSLKVDFNNNLSLISFLILSLVTFQWITRGYLPQEVDHAVYMFIPIWVLKRFFTKKVEVTAPEKANRNEAFT
ncbi:O-antigen polymerase [Niastella sp. OAS944]|uniref:O-antigen polymerase n=1 Tax=Niastella sp. OAS944 TaxID=2664089 RepID=UPI00348A8CAF|nr:hypothetical protein [Chitinophagaceae bacterium OAS944]